MTLHGLYALRGFDYQVTVTLDVLLQHFQSGAAQKLLARPEGDDDLVLRSGDHHGGALRYVQIKKPTESAGDHQTKKSWTVADVARELLPGTLARLSGNQHEQTWILGDAVDPDVLNLVGAGLSAPTTEAATYLTVLHLLARTETKIASAAKPNGSRGERDQAKSRLDRWRPQATGQVQSGTGVGGLADAFIAKANSEGVPQKICDDYRVALSAVHLELAHALARTSVRCTYGTEAAIRERVQRELAEWYGLSLDVVANTLIRNLRGFIQDVATQPDKWVDREEFDLELRSVWPRMNLVAEPPALASSELKRQRLVDALLLAASQGAAEVTGVSGAGKTKVASAVWSHVRTTRPDLHCLYLEVRPEHEVRDVLVGVAFHLRRFGVKEPFMLATQHQASDERALRAIAKSLCAHSVPTLLLLDLVQGTCSDAFARELAILVEELEPTVSLVAFGQESALRGLSALERLARNLPATIDLPGFDFEEFLELAQNVQPVPPERNELWPIFQTATGGRSAGLSARLADALARSASIERMRVLVSLPSDQALAEADRVRYLDIPAELRDATDRVVCFALPFRREDAEATFPQARIADGIRELLKRGLLRSHDADLLEMHETVRAGLERLAPPVTRTDAHSKLAEHYEKIGNSIAVVHHLEQSGRHDEAHRVARDGFLAGRQRLAFAPYVAKHRLVSADELVAELLIEPLPEHVHVVPDLLENFRSEGAADALLEAVRAQGARFESDYRWATLVTDAIVASAPARIEHLVDFCLTRVSQSEESAIDYLAHGARKRLPVVSSRLLDTFAKQPQDVKARLVPLLLLDARRDVLGPVLLFVAQYELPDSGSGRNGWRWPGTGLGSPLRLQRSTDVRELLGSLPLQETSQTIVSKSVLFGRLENWVWMERRVLQPECVRILEGDETDETVLENAIRVLVFLGDSRAVRLAERYSKRRNRLGNVATFVPALLPSAADPSQYRSRLLDVTQDQNERLGDLSVLLHMGADMSELLSELVRVEPEKEKLWRWLFVTNAVHRPWAGGIPILEEMLAERGNDDDNALFGPLVLKFGELPGPAVTEFLMRQVRHPWTSIRMFAALALTWRRSRSALQTLLDVSASEQNLGLARQILVAGVASGPTSVRSFDGLFSQVDAPIWRIVLAGRLRAESEADYLVNVAVDPSQHWQLRRMAILAATKLPYERALAAIVPSILAERSTFTVDTHPSLHTHSFIAELLLEEARGLRSCFLRGRAQLEGLVRDIVDAFGKREYGSVPGDDAASWLYERLQYHGWASTAGAADKVLNELHVPILQAAALRGLRCSGNYAVLEELIPKCDSPWLLSRALMECKKGRKLSTEEHDKIKQLVDSNPLGSNYSPQNIIKSTTPSPPRAAAPPVPSPAKAEKRVLDFAEVQQLLRGSDALDGTPLVLNGLTAEELGILAEQLAPDGDYPKRWVPSQPQLGLTATGFTVQGMRLTSVPANRELREKLRPALVAANHWGVAIPWHPQLLRGNAANSNEKYAEALLRCLQAQMQPERLYEELTANGDLLFPLFDDHRRISAMRPLLDARAVPFLLRFANSGTDALFESMCWIAGCIDDAAIDPVLEALFTRWVHRFNLAATGAASVASVSFWGAFGSLRKHTRFRAIPNFDLRLAELLRHKMDWFRKRDIVNALSESPRAYVHHETMLFRAAPFEHYAWDEVDRLEEYADGLFHAATD